jgi:3-hydroxyacyl-CoA dehydrogenase
VEAVEPFLENTQIKKNGRREKTEVEKTETILHPSASSITAAQTRWKMQWRMEDVHFVPPAAGSQPPRES